MLSVNSGPWRTVLPLRCSSRWKRPTRCPFPLRTESWPTRGVRENSTVTASKRTSHSQSRLCPSSRSLRARHPMQVAVKAREAAFPLLSPMKTQSECGTVSLQCIFYYTFSWCVFIVWVDPVFYFSPDPGRKQKTPKKFTGEQPSISGTFGLKGKFQQKTFFHVTMCLWLYSSQCF